MKRRAQTLYAALTVAVLGIGAGAVGATVAPTPAATAAVANVGAAPATELNNLFNNYGNQGGYAARCAQWSGGDGTQSMVLPDGRRLWSFSDTYLGAANLRTEAFDTSFIRNSFIVQSGSTLRTITGGNTCQERNQSLDFYSRYAKTPVAGSDSAFYWTGAGKVVGNKVVKFYFRNVVDGAFWRETNATMTVQPVSDFDNSVVNPALIQIPAVTPFEDDPIIWVWP